MAAANPNSGAFSVYAERAMGKTTGATIGWLWWLQLVVVIAAEALGAAALLFSVWPAIPVWVLSLVFMMVFTAINLAGVKNFGEFEFWFAILKVAAIILFLAIGGALLLGLLPDVDSPGLGHLVTDFAPAGLGGIAAALFVVVFAFGGTEIVSVAAAETEDPEHSVGTAIRTVVWRILVFYIGSVFVIAAVLPAGSEALASRFAVMVSVAFGFFATILELLFPDRILPALFQLVGSTCLVVWGSALLSQLILRARADRDATVLPLRMRGFPWLTILGLVLLGLIFAVGFWAEDSRGQLFSTLLLISAIAAACRAGARMKSSRSR